MKTENREGKLGWVEESGEGEKVYPKKVSINVRVRFYRKNVGVGWVENVLRGTGVE